MPPKIIPKWLKESKKTGESPNSLKWEQNIQESNVQVKSPFSGRVTSHERRDATLEGG
jgi:hypothetical protein